MVLDVAHPTNSAENARLWRHGRLHARKGAGACELGAARQGLEPGAPGRERSCLFALGVARRSCSRSAWRGVHRGLTYLQNLVRKLDLAVATARCAWRQRLRKVAWPWPSCRGSICCRRASRSTTT